MAEREVFLFFQDGNDDAYCYPLSAFRGFRHAGDTSLVMHFSPANNTLETTAGGLKDIVTITLVTADTERACMKDIIDTINGHPHISGMIVKSDVDATMDNVSGITSCAITRAAV